MLHINADSKRHDRHMPAQKSNYQGTNDDRPHSPSADGDDCDDNDGADWRYHTFKS